MELKQIFGEPLPPMEYKTPEPLKPLQEAQLVMPINPFREKLKEIGFPAIPFPRKSVLIQGKTGSGKTLYGKYIQTVLNANNLDYSLYDEVSFEIESKKFQFDVFSYEKEIFKGKYIIMDQLFNGIARIIGNEKSYTALEYLIDQLYQNSFSFNPKIIIGLTNRNFQDIPIPEDTKRKIDEIFKEKIRI
jgi:Cdc6-like AAA superfamily ATPase